MRLTPKEPENFADYKFEGDHDFLNRKPTGDQLTRLITTIHSPLVIAVDGEWGSGKSHFLKCWVNEPEPAITTVYVDAFKQDYIDDPLIALVSALDTAIDKDAPDVTQKAIGKVKRIAPILGRFALRTAVNYATLGAGNLLDEAFAPDTEGTAETTLKGAANDAGDAIGDMTADFWQAETNRQNAMEAFGKALKALTQPDENGTPTHNIAIVIDELDRCRPDYALNMLEVVKHFFEIDGINFVLGVNMTSLENSVKARYGAGIDAARYLQKFININTSLKMRSKSEASDPDALIMFDKTIQSLGLNTESFSVPREYIEKMAPSKALPLRGIQRLISEYILAVTASPLVTEGGEYVIPKKYVISDLLVLRTFYPDLYQSAKHSNLDSKDLRGAFNIKREDNHRDGKNLISDTWGQTINTTLRLSNVTNHRTRCNDLIGDTRLPKFIADHLYTISLPD